MPRVFVVQDPGQLSDRSFEAAEIYGELTYIFEPHEKFSDPTAYTHRMAEALRDYNPQRDFLLLSGRVEALFVLGAFLGRWPQVMVLRWYSQTKSYAPIPLHLETQENIL